jgi:hypothetical protein
MRMTTCLLAGLALGAASMARASEDFTCNGHIIEEGMDLDVVQSYCGPPRDQSGDRWIYDRGPDELLIILHVQPDNTVGDIESRSRE